MKMREKDKNEDDPQDQKQSSPEDEEHKDDPTNPPQEADKTKGLHDRSNSLESNAKLMTIILDDIIGEFYRGLLPQEDVYISQDFPKQDFPHNVNLKITVVKREQIPDILNPPEPPENEKRNKSVDSISDDRNDSNVLSGYKRTRNGDHNKESENSDSESDANHKRFKYTENE